MGPLIRILEIQNPRFEYVRTLESPGKQGYCAGFIGSVTQKAKVHGMVPDPAESQKAGLRGSEFWRVNKFRSKDPGSMLAKNNEFHDADLIEN